MRSKFNSLSPTVFLLFLGTPLLAQALPFSILPKAGTTLPTQLISGQTANAFYTINNNTVSVRANNFIKYLPPNVTQVTVDSNVSDLCGPFFTLQPNHANGSSCTLELLVSGAVNGNDPDPKHHLFACFPGGITCAGTPSPLNVTVVNGASEFVAGGFYQDINSNNFFGFATSTNNGVSWLSQGLTPLDGYQNGQIQDVSCVGSLCVGVGGYDDLNSNSFAAIAVSQNQGASWRQQVFASPSGFDSGLLIGIYCNATMCLSAGGYNNTLSGYTQPAIARTTDNGNSWSQQVLSLPAGILQGAVESVVCKGNTCLGAVFYEDGSLNTLPGIITSSNGGLTWSQQVLSLPAGFSSAALKGISCTEGACIAVGDYVDNSSNNNLGLAISTNNGASWSQKILTPLGSFTQGSFNGISCTNNYCVAVGNYSFGVSYTGYPAIALTMDNGASWVQQTLPIPNGYTYGYLNGINCVVSTCVASGYYESSTPTPFVAVSTNSGNTWSQQILTPPSPFVEGEFKGVG